MSNIIDKIQVSGVTYDIGGGSITIDPTLDSGSTNPVANSAITTALDEKVNVADNIVSAATINYAYDAGDTSYKHPYNNGLIINEFYVKPVNQYTYTNTAAWSSIYITNGSSRTGIKVNVDCGNYQITAVTSTSGENFTYAIEDGVLHITLSEGYTVQTILQNSNFIISFTKYTIESGQTADVINEDLIDVIQDIYDQVPKAYLSAVTPNLGSTNLTILNTKSDGSNSGQYISFGSSIKGDNNKMDVYLPSRYTTNVTLNTGNSNYCQVPSSTVNDYNTGFAYMDLAVNTGYTGSSTSFTFTVKTLFGNNTVQTDTFTYDVANKTIGGNQLYIGVFYVNNTISIYPKQYNISRIQSVSESNCKICGVDSPFKTQYIITGVTAASYIEQANTVIDEIYTELNGKASTTYVNQSTSGKAETTAVTEAISEATSGKVDTSVYTAYTAATDTVLSGKQDTLSAGTGIDITDNIISATGGGGGKAIEAGRGITITTGATADTVSFNLPIYKGSGTSNLILGDSTNPTASGTSCIAVGNANTKAIGQYSFAWGEGAQASGITSSGGAPIWAIGTNSLVKGNSSFAFGKNLNVERNCSFSTGEYNNNYYSAYASFTTGSYNNAYNFYEVSFGRYNNSVSASATFGDSGNTLFSVGNGTANNARHNAFEIRQNGDIYISSGGTDIKLQDNLGGGGSSYSAGTGIDITNDVISVTGKADTSAVTAIQDSLSGYVTTDTEQTISGRKIFTYSANSGKAIEFKQTSNSAKVGFRIINSAETNNELASFELRPNTFTIDNVQHPLLYFGHYRSTSMANAGVPQTVIGFRQYDQLNAAAYHYLIPLPEKAKTPFSLTTSFKDYYAPMGFKNGSTMITADNTGVVDLSSELGGLKLVKLSQSEYDALSPNYDSNTLYVIVN